MVNDNSTTAMSKPKEEVSPVKREMEILETNIEMILERLSQLSHKLGDFLPEDRVTDNNESDKQSLNESPFVNKMKDNNRMLKGCLDKIFYLISNLEI